MRIIFTHIAIIYANEKFAHVTDMQKYIKSVDNMEKRKP